ncbi:MAG: mechanosensitive ion channel family protein [Deltaproteobacteria bacterium]|nr:mechanosensitive ion channel family protein [Deltaproteobacteria bacterium]
MTSNLLRLCFACALTGLFGGSARAQEATPPPAQPATQPTSAPAVPEQAAKREVVVPPEVKAQLSASGKRHLKIKAEEKINDGLGKPPKDLDRSTPMKSWSAFLAACAAKKWERAAHGINLEKVAKADRKPVGVATATKICALLNKTSQLSAKGLDDTTVGPMIESQPTNYVVTAHFDIGKKLPGELWLRHTHDKTTKEDVWLLTQRTVSYIGPWHRLLVQGEKERAAVPMINTGLGKIPPAFELSSPQAAARTFSKLARERNYEQAAYLLDLRRFKKAEQKERGEKLARRLSMVLSRLEPGYAERLSDDPDGVPERGVPDDEEVLLSPKAGKRSFSVRLILYPRLDAEPVWVFSPGTVGSINALYESFGPGWAGDYLPPIMFSIEVFNVQLWQWIGIILGLLVAYIFGYLASFFSRKLLLRAAKLTKWEWDDELVEATRGPMRLLLAAVGFVIVVGVLSLHPGAQQMALGGVKLVAIIAAGWFFARALDVAADAGLEFFRERGDEVGMAMVPVARKIFKPILWALILIVALQNIGLNVAGLIAGLGIGGLALAMASKTTVENMLGGITIAFDRPFKVGDFVKVGDITGSVEEVGLRSTRVRTLDRTVVTVPNGQMADSKIENYTRRDRIRLVFKIGVQYDSSLDQLKYIIDEIKRAVLRDEKMVHEGFRVRFVGFGDSSLDIEVYCYINTTDYNEFTAVREKLYLEVAKIVAGAGAEFAFPSRTVYNGKASDADSKKAKFAAQEVELRLAAGELTIPEIPESVREKLQKPS